MIDRDEQEREFVGSLMPLEFGEIEISFSDYMLIGSQNLCPNLAEFRKVGSVEVKFSRNNGGISVV